MEKCKESFLLSPRNIIPKIPRKGSAPGHLMYSTNMGKIYITIPFMILGYHDVDIPTVVLQKSILIPITSVGNISTPVEKQER